MPAVLLVGGDDHGQVLVELRVAVLDCEALEALLVLRCSELVRLGSCLGCAGRLHPLLWQLGLQQRPFCPCLRWVWAQLAKASPALGMQD